MARLLLKQMSLLGLVLFALGNYLLAQTGTLAGTISDKDGQPLQGASVKLPALSIGALTAEGGKFSLANVPVGDHQVEIDFIGYLKETRTVKVEAGQSTRLNVVLQEEALSLDEVVMVGYGTQRRRSLVGSVSKIDSEDLNETIGASFETALQGKAPGVQITQTSGVAGAGAVIRIRGIGSLSSGGDPLIVVDGIPITQDPFLSGETGGLNNNPLSSINPEDIQSVEILKDAAATAIFGSRGSNGVILITTKRGKQGKPQFKFNARVGLSEPSNMLDFLNAEEWLMVQQEAWENDGGVGRVPLPQNLTYEEIEGVDTDWMNEVLQTGVKQEYSASMSQGTKKFKSYVGLSYIDTESYQKGNSFRRLTARANVDYNILPNLRLSLSTSLARGLNDRISQAWAGGFGWAQSTALPIFPIKDQNGDWFNLYGNPVAQRELVDWITQEWRSINNAKLTFTPVKGLNINATGNYDYMNLGDYFLEDSTWTNFSTIAKRFASEVVNWSTYLTADYNWQLSDNQNLALLVGSEYQSSSNNRFNEEYADIYEHLYNVNDLAGADTLNFSTTEVDRWLFASVFAKLNYDYMDKLFLQATFRRDGSSKFGRNRRFGNFPGVGVGYIISEEDWFQNSVVNYMKLKSSYGITGNADIAWDEQFPRYFLSQEPGIVRSQGYNGFPVRNQVKLDNPDLQWEVSRTLDAGVEIGLFNDRITTEIGYYYKLTTDAIININIQASSGIDNIVFPQNVGKIENEGVELRLTTRNLVNKFKWTSDLNLAFNRNLVLEVGTATPDALDGGFGDTRAVPGFPVNTNFIVKFSRLDPESGRPIYLTRDGEETYDYDVVLNRQPAGDGMPRFTGGFSNTFSYGKWNLDMLWVFSYGGMIYDDAAKRQLGVVTDDWNMRRDVFDRWREPGDEARLPRWTRSMINWGGNANFWQNNHSLWLEDASYARLRNLSLSYVFDQFSTPMVRRLRLTLSGTNLLTFTNYSGWDPEVARDRSSPGQRNIGGTNVTYLTAPQERTYNLALSVDF
ncbi:MAG: SusC/RagA family TonB-linked outer membrane protein [Bacteroidota bacterium]